MTPRERVMTAFAHEEPDRVPTWCGASTGFWNKAKDALDLDDEGLRVRLGDDFRYIYPRYAGPTLELWPGAHSVSIFGVQRSGSGEGQPMHHPLAAATLAEVHGYPWPRSFWIDVSTVYSEAAAHHPKYAVMSGERSPFWQDLTDLMGMENMYTRMYDEPEVIDAILNRLVDYYIGVNAKLFEAAAGKVDIFFIGTDLGGQRGPMLSDAMFRRFLLPHLKRLVDLGHDYKLKVMMHCCGGVYELIPALIEIGMDGLQAVQPSCAGMDLTRLKERFGDRILFNGAIDSQNLLMRATPDEVRRQTAAVLAIMKPGGGYVAGASDDSILEETPLQNVLAMFDAIHEFGVYR